MTTCTPAASASRALPSAWSGCVKSTSTSASPSTSATAVSRAGSARPVSSMSSAPSTAAQTVCPMRPAAPATATRITRDLARGGHLRRGLAERGLVGPDAGRGQALGRPQLVGQGPQVVERHGVDALHDLVGLEDREVVEQRRAEAVHPRAGRLHAEHDARLDVLAGARPARPRRRAARAAGRARRARPASPGARLSGPGAEVEADLARVGELAVERVDRVGEPALLAHGLEQPRGGQAAEDRVEHAHREAALVAALQARGAEAHVALLGVLAVEAHGAAQLRRRRVGHRARPPPRAGRRACARPARRSGRGRPSPPRRSRPSAARSGARGSAEISSTGVSRMTGARPMIGRPSGWPPKTASPSTSKTVSCGSSSYIAISSSTTSRSGSMSRNAGRQTMSAMTSKARGEVLVEHPRVDRGGLLVGAGVELGAHAVEQLVDLRRGEAVGAAEQQVLEEVREPGLVGGLAARAGGDEEAQGRGPDGAHVLRRDPQPRVELRDAVVGQCPGR